MVVTGKTKVLGLIGAPVLQARTPALANQLLSATGKLGEFVLVPMHVPTESLEGFVRGMKSMQNFAGAVVTMPHKEHIVPLLDGLLPEASLVGAVNVIRRREDGDKPCKLGATSQN
jgi:shikimate dehydrogenase